MIETWCIHILICQLPVTSKHTHIRIYSKRFIFTFASLRNGSKRITEKLSSVQLLIFAIICAITLKICLVFSNNNVSIWENQIRQISFKHQELPKCHAGGCEFNSRYIHICNLQQSNGLIEPRKLNRNRPIILMTVQCSTWHLQHTCTLYIWRAFLRHQKK